MTVHLDPQATPVSASPAKPNALDFQQFVALRRGADARDPAALREVARQFESIFTKMMLESMRSASFGDPLFGSDQTDLYQGMMDDQMAVQLSSGRGIGLADLLIRQLGQGGVNGAAPGGPGDPVSAGASAGRPISDAQRREFVERLLPQARAAARELGVDERAILAQAALETGWGTSQPADGSGASHNLFGIKAGSHWSGPSVQSETTEYRDGVPVAERARFRAYGSVAENLEDYVRLLRDNPRYAGALNTGGDVRAFATALQRGGYATDPAYADKIVAVAARIEDVTSIKSAAIGPIHGPESSSQHMRTDSNG